MLRNYPTEQWELETLERLNAEPWMVTLLKLNPSYTCWGPGEDSMCSDDRETSWSTSKEFKTWRDFGPWGVDELNEIVHFYFELDRESEECKVCGGDGYNAHPGTKEVVNGFYRTMNNRGMEWQYDLTRDELQALFRAGRFYKATKCPELSELKTHLGPGGHDAINRSILTETRLARLNLPRNCDVCEGHGYVFTQPSAHMNAVLWFLHPRKGCSRGVRVRITSDDLPEVVELLKAAHKRNNERFEAVNSVKFA